MVATAAMMRCSTLKDHLAGWYVDDVLDILPAVSQFLQIWSSQNCCAVAILQHGLPWRRRPETLSRVNYKQTLMVFLTIVVYRVIVGSLVTSL
jgi:hypothetical protein